VSTGQSGEGSVPTGIGTSVWQVRLNHRGQFPFILTKKRFTIIFAFIIALKKYESRIFRSGICLETVTQNI